MTGLVIAACILAVLLLLCQLRVGAAVAYDQSGLRLAVKLGPFHIRILPPEKKKPPKSKEKQPAKQKEAGGKPKEKGGSLALLKEFLPLAAEAAGRFKRKIRIDRIKLYVVSGASDPAATAMGFGSANAAVGMLWPLLEHNFHIKEREVRVDVDFEQHFPTAALDAQVTLTIGQGLVLGVGLGVKALKIYLAWRREQKEKKAVQV